jgi:hypothetical protein
MSFIFQQHWACNISLESELSLLGDSSRMVCSDGDPLWDMPMTMASESPPLRCGVEVVGVVIDELEVFEACGLILGDVDTEQEDIVGSDGGYTWIMEPSERLEEKHAASPPSWRTNCRCFIHRQDIGWSRSRVLILRWPCELQSTLKFIFI